MYGKMMSIPRLQAWYGDEHAIYSYSNLTLRPYKWTPTVSTLKLQVERFCERTFNAMLANCYRDQNDSVSWHSDDEPELGKAPFIASLSFGCEREMQFKHKRSGEKFKLPLQSGSLLVMSGETQENWQHAILKTRIEKIKRINLTFRNIL